MQGHHDLEEGVHYRIKTRERDIDIHPDISAMAPPREPRIRVKSRFEQTDIDTEKLWSDLKEIYGDDIIPRLNRLYHELLNLGNEQHTRLVIDGLFLAAGQDEDLMQILDPDRTDVKMTPRGAGDVVNMDGQTLVECGYCGKTESTGAFIARCAYTADTLQAMDKNPLDWTFHHLTFSNKHRTLEFLPAFVD